MTNLNTYQVSVYPFDQSQIISREILHRPSGSTARTTLVTGAPYGFCEADNRLLVLSQSENAEPVCRVFDAACQQVLQIPAPFLQDVSFVLEDKSRLFFFVTEAGSPQHFLVYPFDKKCAAFDEVAQSFFIPEGQACDGIAPCDNGFIVALTDAVSRDAIGRSCGNSRLYHLSEDNTLPLIEDLGQRVE